MALKPIEFDPPPVQSVVAGEGGMLSLAWERWYSQIRAWILKRPSCHVYFDDDQSIPNATRTDLLFDQRDHDTASMHSTTTNTDRITIPSDGIYCFGGHAFWAANATGLRQVAVTLNDAAVWADSAALVDCTLVATAGGGNAPKNILCCTRSLTAGDILRLGVYQDSTGALNVRGTNTDGPRSNGFWCFKYSDPPTSNS